MADGSDEPQESGEADIDTSSRDTQEREDDLG